MTQDRPIAPEPPFVVLINAEEQYGIHPALLANPLGWRAAGFAGSEQECAAWVDARWTDMRPLSARTVAEQADPELSR